MLGQGGLGSMGLGGSTTPPPSTAVLGSGSGGGSGGPSLTWNPADTPSNLTLSNGNRDFNNTWGSGFYSTRATVSKLADKWYFELVMAAASNASPNIGFGLADATFDETSYLGSSGNSCMLWGNNTGSFASGNMTMAYQPAYSGAIAAGDVFMFAVDSDAGKAWIGRNGTWAGSGDPATGVNPWVTFTVGTALFPAGTAGGANDGTGRLPEAATYAAPAGFTGINDIPVGGSSGGPSLTEADDTLSATGTILLNATLSRQMEQDTLGATAQLRLGASLTRTEQNDTLAAASQLAVQASLAKTLANDTLSASSTLEIQAGANGLEQPDTLAATTLLQNTFISATLARTEADDALTASSKLDIQAVGQCYEASDTLTATGFPGNSADFAGVEDPDTLGATGSLAIAARSAATEANDTLAAATHIETLLFAALNKIEADDRLTGAGALLVTANAPIQEVNDRLISIISAGVIWDGDGDGGGVTFTVPASGSLFTVPSSVAAFVVPAVESRFEVPAAPSFVFPR